MWCRHELIMVILEHIGMVELTNYRSLSLKSFRVGQTGKTVVSGEELLLICLVFQGICPET